MSDFNQKHVNLNYENIILWNSFTTFSYLCVIIQNIVVMSSELLFNYAINTSQLIAIFMLNWDQ